MKRHIITVFFILVAVLGIGVPTYAKGSKWEALNDEVMALYQKGQYDRAVIVAKKALEVAEKAFGPEHPNVATSLDNLALIYKTQGQYAQAEPLLKRSLAIREKALGPDHPDVAMSLNNLVNLYASQGQYEQAEPLFKRSQEIIEKALGSEHPYVATILNNKEIITQSDMNQEACEKLTEAEDKLKNVYHKIRVEYVKNPPFLASLELAQQAWEKYRDAHLEAIFPGEDKFYYGSVNPMCYAYLKADITYTRIKELEKWLQEQEEGDVCLGSYGDKERFQLDE